MKKDKFLFIALLAHKPASLPCCTGSSTLWRDGGSVSKKIENARTIPHPALPGAPFAQRGLSESYLCQSLCIAKQGFIKQIYPGMIENKRN
ncbi:MAG: hypothetical protein IJD59_01345 [Clostridia bacterium]|nr:hypothetical protein [Clostridia bacterium]